MNPASDVWVDTTRKPDVLVNLNGDKDAWDFVLGAVNSSPFAVEWGNWQTLWAGSTTTQQNLTDGRLTQQNFARVTTTTTAAEARSGVRTQATTGTITQSIGDRIVDVSVIPYMRAKSILFAATDFKPDTVFYPFFDNTPV